jgi:glycerol-1-phosphate dehydrogenase [NAD(P)+]
MSGRARAVPVRPRPASGGDHEIFHAINKLYPGTGSHGELAGVGALFCTFLREDQDQAGAIAACLARHGLPRTPADLGLSHAEFAKAVAYAPETRPGRYTILERLALSEVQIAERVEEYARAFGR